MTIEEFYQDLPAQLKEYKESLEGIYTTPPEAFCFTHYVLNRFIVERGANNIIDYDCFNPGSARYQDKQGKNLGEIHAYAIHEKKVENEDGDYDTRYELDLYFTHFENSDQRIPVLTATKFGDDANKIVGFYEKARTGNNPVPETAKKYHITKWIFDNEKSIDRVNICMLTNCRIESDTVKSRREKSRKILFCYDENNVWDLDKLYHIYDGDLDREPIDVDFVNTFKCKIPCVVSRRIESYYTVLSVIPGSIVRDLYITYEDRLLESNVRLFLGVQKSKSTSTKTKSKKPKTVNACIRETLINSPSKFMAYNNGISATGSSASIEMIGDELGFITSIKDFQIVNGGQTTVSIARAYDDYGDEMKIEDVFVSMKLTIVSNTEDLEDDISAISISSNRQNTVPFSNFSSNNLFNRSLERIVNRIYITNPITKVQTRWYFDRKGKYTKDFNALKSASAKRRYKEETPKGQVFKKEDVANVWQAWDGQPLMALSSSSTSYSTFIESHDKEIEKWEAQDLISMFIIHRGITNRLSGDRKAHLAYYVMALLHKLIPDFDLYKIYTAQVLPDDICTPLVNAAKNLRVKIRDKYGLTNDLRNAMKSAECWEWAQTLNLIDLPQEIIFSYKYDPVALKARKKSSETEIELPSIELHDRISAMGRNFWNWIAANDTEIMGPGIASQIIMKITMQQIYSPKEISEAIPVLEKYEGNDSMLDFISKSDSNLTDRKDNNTIRLAYRFAEIDSIANWKKLFELERSLPTKTGITALNVNSIRKKLIEKRYSDIKYQDLQKIINAYERLSKFKAK